MDPAWVPPPDPTTMADLFPPGTDLCTIPAREPPPGDVNNFADEGLRSPAIAISVILIAISIVLTFGRLYANSRKLSLSDLFVFLAMLLSISQGVTMIVFVRYFRHIWDVPLCWLNGEFMLISYVWQVIYVFNQFFAKTATLLLFYQLFTVSAPMRTAVRGGILFASALYTTGLSLSSYYAAPHVGQTWDQIMVDSVNTTIFALYWGVAQAAANTVFDMYIFILPLPIIYRLNLSLKRKVQVTALFLVALFGVISSIISLVYRVRSIQGLRPDSTFNVGVLMICNLSEMSAALIICTAPAFASFIRVNVMGSQVFKYLRSTWEMSRDTSDFSHTNKGSENINRPRTQTDDRQKKKHGELRNMTGYIEMSDTWLLNSGTTTVDIEAPKQITTTNDEDSGLRVTTRVDVEHTPVTSYDGPRP